MAKINFKLNVEVFNEIYLKALFYSGRYLHLWGGAGSGKSRAAAQKIIYEMLTESGYGCLIIRKVFRSIRDSQFKELCIVIRDWHLDELFDIRKSTMRITCKLNGNFIIPQGVDNSEKLKSISSINRVWVEEPTELNYDEWLELVRRVRGIHDTYVQIILTYNPVNYYSWLNQKIHLVENFTTIDNEGKVSVSEDSLLINSTHRDNLFLTPEDREVLIKQNQQSQVHGNIYDKGKWSLPENVIYGVGSFRFVDKLSPKYIHRVIGIDFGINVPTAVTLCQWVDLQTIETTELLYRSHVTNGELINFLKSQKEYINNKTFIYCDSAEKNRIIEIANAGFNAHPANKAVTGGIDYLHSVEFCITEKSENIKTELSLYEWKKNNQGEVTDEPIKLNDHALDSIRYAAYTHACKYITPKLNKGGKKASIPIAPNATSRTRERFRNI